MKKPQTSSWIKRHIEETCSNSPEFKAAYDAEIIAEAEAHAATEQTMRALVQRRQTLGWTQKQVAERLGISQARVSQIEKLKDGVSAHMLVRYAQLLGLGLAVREERKAYGEPKA